MSCLDSCKAAACSIAYHILKENARLSTKIFLIICKKGLNYYLIAKLSFQFFIITGAVIQNSFDVVLDLGQFFENPDHMRIECFAVKCRSITHRHCIQGYALSWIPQNAGFVPPVHLLIRFDDCPGSFITLSPRMPAIRPVLTTATLGEF